MRALTRTIPVLLLAFTLLALPERGHAACLHDGDAALLEGTGLKSGPTNPASPLRPISFVEEVEKSGLSSDQLDRLEKSGAKLTDIYSFMRKNKKDIDPNKLLDLVNEDHAKEGHGAVLGMSDRMLPQAVSMGTGMADYFSAGARVGVRASDTANYLDALTREGQPIVFLIPRGVFQSGDGFTASELRWFLEHPDRAKNVTFVFGAYESVPANETQPVRAMKLFRSMDH